VHEGSPNVVKEALACNLPVVSVDVGDVRTRLNGIEGCFVCSEAHPKALAECLERVLAANVRIAGREKVAELSEESIAAKVIEVYWTAMQKHSVKNQALRGPETETGSI
jgi:glycosyltransferase involved in cell wall biosynthesis